MENDDIEFVEIPEAEVEVIAPTPWHNSDTVAASFMFASSIAIAASEHFKTLSLLAVGQSAQEWHERDTEEFIVDSLDTIKNLPEGGEVDE